MMLADLEEYPNKINWAYLVKDLLSRMGFYDVWLTQGVANLRLFLSLLKQRLTDNFESCPFGLPLVPFVNCRRFMYLVISLLVYRAGCGI